MVSKIELHEKNLFYTEMDCMNVIDPEHAFTQFTFKVNSSRIQTFRKFA